MTCHARLTGKGTSKHEPCEPLLGSKGTFLASLSAVSLLSITSHHHAHRSHNTITFHHAKAIERQLPALSQHEIHSKHGTRVAVRNLFGNLPVRVKQRSRVLEHKPENDRLWESLRANMAGLLLSWAGTVSVKVRDSDNRRTIFNFNTSDTRLMARKDSAGSQRPRSAHLASMLNVLTQANYVSIDEWSSWVPASASTPAISIKGAISLDPAPSKNVQFISLGVRPLSAELEHNELYDHINRLFALSTFGMVEDNAERGHLDKLRRQTDQPFKMDRSTNQQLKARKGVDRYPMFHLRIVLLEGLGSAICRDQDILDETSLQTILDVLGAMTTQWLSAHHFRPVQPRRKRNLPTHPSTRSLHPSSIDPATTSSHNAQPLQPHMIATDPAPSVDEPVNSGTATKQGRRLSVEGSVAPPEKSKHRAFAEWTRIKSGKASFFDDASDLAQFPLHGHPTRKPQKNDGMPHRASLHEKRPNSATVFELTPLARGALDPRTPQRLNDGLLAPAITDDDREDSTILWTDPLTKKTHLLNARTGCVMPHTYSRPAIEPSMLMSDPSRTGSTKSLLRLAPKTFASEQTPWLDGLLKAWANPVFSASEKRIHQISQEENTLDQSSHQKQHQCYLSNIEKAFHGSPHTGSNRLSRDGLSGAEVVAQVDKKFVLVRMSSTLSEGRIQDMSNCMLTLIDQHAADERIQVEALFEELCTPIVPNTYRSRLGHCAMVASTLLDKPVQFVVSPQELTHFTTHAESFARWGILYDILASVIPADGVEASAKDQRTLSVTSLPPSISERCKSDAGLLISLLRSAVWKYASGTCRVPSVSFPSDKTPSWVQRLASCPEGLVDMINSRACRCAIMFNDELSFDQCKRLVTRLAACVFPFMCAHGRPSMVPLVNFGRLGDSQSLSKLDRCGEKEGFVQAWKQWKR
jgi:DNA mismatch repair protein MLH3